MTRASLARSIVTVGGWTLLSRGAGFARDMMMAAYLGAGPVADAFNVAFSLPNMFRRFFAEGAFNMAFVPMFAKKLEGGEDATRLCAGCVQRAGRDPDRVFGLGHAGDAVAGLGDGVGLCRGCAV